MLSHFEGVSLTAAHSQAARLTCESPDLPKPGQGFLALKPGVNQPLRRTLFPTSIHLDGFTADVPPHPSWSFGDPIDLVGPLGGGFTPPREAVRWLLVSIAAPPLRLLPLMELGLNQNVAISLWSEPPLDELPPQVEVNPSLGDALSWADYLALDLPLDSLQELRLFLGITDRNRLPPFAQALIMTPMPCGIGTCHACSIKGDVGWLLTCSDGPIFDLNRMSW